MVVTEAAIIAGLFVAAKDILTFYSSYKTSGVIQSQQRFQEWLTYDQAKKIRQDISETEFRVLKLAIDNQETRDLLTALIEGSRAQEDKLKEISIRLEEFLSKPTLTLQAHHEILRENQNTAKETLRVVIADQRENAEIKALRIAELEREIEDIGKKLEESQRSLQQAIEARQDAAAELLYIRATLPENEFENAFLSLAQGDSEKAFDTFEMIVNTNSDLSFKAACIAAKLAESDGKLVKSAALMDKAVNLAPDNIDLAVSSARIHIAISNYRKASRIVVSALEENGYHEVELLEPDDLGQHKFVAIHIVLGTSDVGQGNTGKAIEHFTSAFSVMDFIGPSERIKLFLGRADAYNQAEQASLATSDYRAAAAEHSAVGDKLLAATVLNNAGDNEAHRGNYDDAEQLYREAGSNLIGNDVITVTHKNICKGNLGYCIAMKGNISEGLSLMYQSLKYFRDNPEASPLRQSSTLLNISDIFREQRKYERATKLAEEAQQITEAHFGDYHVHSVTALSRVAQCYFESDKLAGAAELYKEGVHRLKAKPLERASTTADMIIGYSRTLCKCIADDLSNDHPSPEEVLRFGLEIMCMSPSSISSGSMAIVRNELFGVLSQDDPKAAIIELDNAIQELSESPELFGSLRLLSWLAMSYQNRANYHISLEDWKTALDAISQSIDMFRKSDFSFVEDLAEVQRTKAYIYLHMNRFEDAKAVRQELIDLIKYVGTVDPSVAANIVEATRQFTASITPPPIVSTGTRDGI